MVSQQNADIADTLQLRDVAMATIFVFLYIGATWQIQLNRPCSAAMRLMSYYFDHLLTVSTLY